MQLTIGEAERSFAGVHIPPRPTLLVALRGELDGRDPNVRKVADLVSRDVALSAAVLKVVNSPAFALRTRIGSVHQAITLLGLRNVATLVSSVLLKSSLGNGVSLERFWDTAEKVAWLAARVATLFTRVPRDEAWAFGLFRDCGIPILLQRFPAYRDTLRAVPGAGRPMTDVEDAAHGTNHAFVGHLVARAWGLPPELAEGIKRHHDASVFAPDDEASPQARTLIAINVVAERLNDRVLRSRDEPEGERLHALARAHLGLTGQEYAELEDEVASSAS